MTHAIRCRYCREPIRWVAHDWWHVPGVVRMCAGRTTAATPPIAAAPEPGARRRR